MSAHLWQEGKEEGGGFHHLRLKLLIPHWKPGGRLVLASRGKAQMWRVLGGANLFLDNWMHNEKLPHPFAIDPAYPHVEALQLEQALLAAAALPSLLPPLQLDLLLAHSTALPHPSSPPRCSALPLSSPPRKSCPPHVSPTQFPLQAPHHSPECGTLLADGASEWGCVVVEGSLQSDGPMGNLHVWQSPVSGPLHPEVRARKAQRCA